MSQLYFDTNMHKLSRYTYFNMAKTFAESYSVHVESKDLSIITINKQPLICINLKHTL